MANLSLVTLLVYIGFICTVRANVERGLHELERYLEKASGNDESEFRAIEKAREWLSSIKDSRPDLVEAIDLFVSLGTLEDKDSCSDKGFSIIKNYNKITGGIAKYGLRKIDRVAFHFMVKHSEICQSEYVKSYETLKTNLDPNKKTLVEGFVNAFTHNAILNGEFDSINPGVSSLEEALESSPLNFIYLMGTFRRNLEYEAGFIGRYLGQKASNYPESRKEYEKLLEQFIYEPCRHYVQVLGGTIYDPIIQDLLTKMDNRRATNKQEELVGPNDFYKTLANVKACRIYALEISKKTLLDTITGQEDEE